MQVTPLILSARETHLKRCDLHVAYAKSAPSCATDFNHAGNWCRRLHSVTSLVYDWCEPAMEIRHTSMTTYILHFIHIVVNSNLLDWQGTLSYCTSHDLQQHPSMLWQKDAMNLLPLSSSDSLSTHYTSFHNMLQFYCHDVVKKCMTVSVWCLWRVDFVSKLFQTI